MYVCGVDPGKLGAAVVIDFNRKIYHKQHFDFLSDEDIAAQIRMIATSFRPAAVIKEIYIPQFSNSHAAFQVGRQHGILDMVIREQGLRRIDVRALEWQKALFPKGNEGMKPKYLSWQTALALYADVDFRATTKTGKPTKKEHEGLIDAANLAAYGVNLLLKERTLEPSS